MQERSEAMTPTELIAAIGDNEAALNALPDDLRNAVLAANKEMTNSPEFAARRKRRRGRNFCAWGHGRRTFRATGGSPSARGTGRGMVNMFGEIIAKESLCLA